jgi:hypothetical protein
MQGPAMGRLGPGKRNRSTSGGPSGMPLSPNRTPGNPTGSLPSPANCGPFFCGTRRGSPINGYILARSGKRVNLDNESKRVLRPALRRCRECQVSELKHDSDDQAFELDTVNSMKWTGWYSLRRFHGTQVRSQTDSSDETRAKALGKARKSPNAITTSPLASRWMCAAGPSTELCTD